MVPLLTARIDSVPVVDAALFAPTIKHMLEHHVRPGTVHDDDFWFFRDCTPHDVMCDIGANLGLSVLSIAATGATPVLHSFEINPALFAGLRQTAATLPSTTWMSSGSFMSGPQKQRRSRRRS